MAKKRFVSGTQVVKTILAVWGFDKPLLRTSTVAGEFELAPATIVRKCVPFISPELSLLWTLSHLTDGRVGDVPEVVLGVNEVVTRVNITVMLDDHRVAARLSEDAQAGVLSHPTGKSGVEDLDEIFTNVFSHPLVENTVQELSVLLRTD